MKTLLSPVEALSPLDCMTTTRRRTTAGVLVLALALGNAACSDDNGSPADLGRLDTGSMDGLAADQSTADQPASDQSIADTGPADAAPGSAIIGAAGGAVASADNNLRLLVPPGALSQDMTFTITPTSSTPSFVSEVPSTVDTIGGTVSAETSHTSTWCIYHKNSMVIACCYVITDAQFAVPAKLQAVFTSCQAVSSVPPTEITLSYEPAGT